MTSWPPSWNYDVKNIPVIFHPYPIWNDEALVFFAEVASDMKKNNKKNNKMISDMGSVSYLKS